MKKKLRVGKVTNQDVVLFRTYNAAASRRACEFLLSDSVPFTRNWEKVPFFLRKTCKANELVTVTVSRGMYSKARRSLDRMDAKDQRSFALNYI